MHNHPRQPTTTPRRVINKLLLSAFVVFSFIAYALHKPFENANGNLGAAAPTLDAQVSQPVDTPTALDPAVTAVNPLDIQSDTAPAETAPATASTAPGETATPTLPAPTTAPTVRLASGQYRDGSYTGPEVDAFYGFVQVQVTVRNGKIADVQFLEYPSDRRTSVRINTFAVPYLQHEAVQAQNANVDIIGGATLTSEAFIRSLQSALSQAKS